MKKIVLITSRFPYVGGEQFLETEIKYYSNIELVILPILKGTQKREIPKDVEVKDIFSNDNWNRVKAFYLMKSLFSQHLYREFFLYNIFNFKKFKTLLSSLMLHQFYIKKLENFLENSNDLENTIFYTYWNNEATYALQSLKNKYGYKIVSRIHGGDIYEERRAFNYLPLKKQFTQNIDKIYTITQSANEYLMERYGFKKDSIALSRLGVEDLSISSLASALNELHLVSCSSLLEIKRVDKIIEALATLSVEKPQLSITWTHMGDGYLRKGLENLAQKKLGDKENIIFSFLGNLKNSEVYKFYQNNSIDLFINVSESEGVPVSIMEAMSCHIPIIAPDIGGIKDMLTDGQNGQLLSEKCEVNEIVEALSNSNFFKEIKVRESAYKLYLEKYSASLNYNHFITSMVEL